MARSSGKLSRVRENVAFLFDGIIIIITRKYRVNQNGTSSTLQARETYLAET